MKSLHKALVCICFLWGLASCHMFHKSDTTPHNVITLLFDTAGYRHQNGKIADLKRLQLETLPVIRNRLAKIGLDTTLCEVSGQGTFITVKIWGLVAQDISIESVRSTLLIQAKLGFWETYPARQVYGLMFPSTSGSDSINEIRYRLKQLIVADSSFFMSDFGANSAKLGYAHFNNKAEINGLLAKLYLPADLHVLWSDKMANNNNGLYSLYIVKGKDPLLSNDVITDAKVYYDSQNGSDKPQISLTMNGSGTTLWDKITRENITKDIAMTIDDRVCVCPRVISEITGGRSSIAGDFTNEEARGLTALLNGGALPAPLIIYSEKIEP